MMRRLLALVVVAALTCLGRPALAAEGDTIVWMVSQIVPHIIREGPLTGKGPTEMYLAAIQRKMPDVKHEVVDGSRPEYYTRAKAGEHICSVGLIRTTEREGYLLFTAKKVHILPPRLIVRGTARTRVGLPNPPDLAAVLAVDARALSFGVVAKRSYGAADALIAAAPKDRVLFAEDTEALLFLSVANQLDAFVAYPEEARFFMRLMYAEDKLGDFTSFPLPGPVLLSVPAANCAKGAWGEAMIARIDAAFDEGGMQVHMGSYEAWLAPNEVDDYRKALLANGIERGKVEGPPT